MSENQKKIVRDRTTGRPLAPKAQPGYYPGFSTMAQKPHWDEATTATIEKRMSPKSLRFFSAEEARLMQAVLDCIIPQDDRDDAHRIPVLALIDGRLFEQKFDGFYYEGTMQDDAAHRMGLKALAALADSLHGIPFYDLTREQQEKVIISLRDGDPCSGWPCENELPAAHYFSVLMKDAVSAYYAHPFAWDEIGFGGPAYPRGYMRLTGGLPEPWEQDETRYEWLAPADTISDRDLVNEKHFAEGHRPRLAKASARQDKK